MKIKILIKTAMLNHKANDVIIVDADKNAIPLNKFWRRRLNDAKEDNCCEIVTPAPKKANKGDK